MSVEEVIFVSKYYLFDLLAVMHPNYYNIGKIVATFGLQGEVVLVHKTGNPEALQGVKTLFVEARRDSFLPYFLESARKKSQEEAFLKLEGVDTKEAAGKLIAKGIYLDETHFREQVRPGSLLYYLGFSVRDSRAGVLGPVAEVIEMPTQLLVKVYQNGHELLIPLNEGTLTRIDQQAAVIYVTLPEGLLDIYQS